MRHFQPLCLYMHRLSMTATVSNKSQYTHSDSFI